MPIIEDHNERIVRLLKKDAERRNYIKEYMRNYRKNNAENGIKQKQYYNKDDVNTKMKENYYKKIVLNDIRYLFKE